MKSAVWLDISPLASDKYQKRNYVWRWDYETHSVHSGIFVTKNILKMHMSNKSTKAFTFTLFKTNDLPYSNFRDNFFSLSLFLSCACLTIENFRLLCHTRRCLTDTVESHSGENGDNPLEYNGLIIHNKFYLFAYVLGVNKIFKKIRAWCRLLVPFRSLPAWSDPQSKTTMRRYTNL